MGKFEKLVVLTVVSTAAIVLAISFYRGSGEVDAADPMSGALRMLDTEKGRPEARAEAPRAPRLGQADAAKGSATPPSLLLHAGEESRSTAEGLRAGEEEAEGIEPAEAELGGPDSGPESGLDSRATEPDPVAGLWPAKGAGAPRLTTDPPVDHDNRILRDSNGLRPSFLDEYRMYTVAEGDTWSGLAQRFYQDGRFTRNLHVANEGQEALEPGKNILVPVFDLLATEGRGPEAESAPASFVPTPAGSTPNADRSPEPRAVTTAKPATAKPTTPPAEYTVRSGDTLSEISQAVFGTSTRWKEILEANRDQLKRPESLQAGMKLTIPAGGKVPAGPVKNAAAKSASGKEPVKADASRAATQKDPKKNKVD